MDEFYDLPEPNCGYQAQVPRSVLDAVIEKLNEEGHALQWSWEVHPQEGAASFYYGEGPNRLGVAFTVDTLTHDLVDHAVNVLCACLQVTKR